jgi:hypothetical protein
MRVRMLQYLAVECGQVVAARAWWDVCSCLHTYSAAVYTRTAVYLASSYCCIYRILLYGLLYVAHSAVCGHI